MDPKTLARALAMVRSRADSEDSQNSVASTDSDVLLRKGHKSIHYQLHEVFEPIPEHIPDPIFVLTDCSVGGTLSAFAILDGKPKILVEGVLEADDEYDKWLSEHDDLPNGRFKTLNGERIEFLMTEVAIGGPPSTIWVGAEKMWFEIRPSAAYRATYQNMLHVVGVHFANLDYHEMNKSWYDMDIHGTPWGVCKVLAECIESTSGSTIFVGDLLKVITEKHNAAFLLSEMRKELLHDPLWHRNPLFRYLQNPQSFDPALSSLVATFTQIATAEEILTFVPEDAQMMDVDDAQEVEANFEQLAPRTARQTSTHVARRTVSRTPANSKSAKASTSASRKTTAAAASNVKPKIDRAFPSSLYPTGCKNFPDMSTVVNAVAMYLVESGIRDISSINIAYLSDTIYINFSIQKYLTAAELIRHYRKEIRANLPAALKKSPLYNELSQPGQCRIPADSKDQRDIDARRLYLEFVAGTKKIVTRGRPGQENKAAGSGSQKVAKSSASPAPAPAPVVVKNLAPKRVETLANDPRTRKPQLRGLGF